MALGGSLDHLNWIMLTVDDPTWSNIGCENIWLHFNLSAASFWPDAVDWVQKESQEFASGRDWQETALRELCDLICLYYGIIIIELIMITITIIINNKNNNIIIIILIS